MMKPADLIETADGAWVLPGAVNLGLVRAGEGFLAVDSGLGEDSAKALLAAARKLGGEITMVFTTHGHADHCGGNEYLQRKTGARVLAPPGEAPFLAQPWLEPAMLAGGAPFPEIRGRFLQAKACRVDAAVEPGPLVDAADAEVIGLPGHSPDMCGLRAGGTLFAADAFFPEETIAKHALVYHYHPRRFLESLERLTRWRSLAIVPSHGPARVADLDAVAAANRRHVLDVEGMVLDMIARPMGRESLAAQLAVRLGVPGTPGAWALALGAVQGYLTGLREAGMASCGVREGKLLWSRA
jgi:glyoxylase-like metal-dependent hydrolase (beta-lactamase superfamily II)